MEQLATTITPVRHRTDAPRSLTLVELEAALIAKCNEIRASLPETGWHEAVDELHRKGDPDLLDAYSMAASLGYLRCDVRWTIWGGRL
jgi:hypothetical protein